MLIWAPGRPALANKRPLTPQYRLKVVQQSIGLVSSPMPADFDSQSHRVTNVRIQGVTAGYQRGLKRPLHANNRAGKDTEGNGRIRGSPNYGSGGWGWTSGRFAILRLLRDRILPGALAFRSSRIRCGVHMGPTATSFSLSWQSRKPFDALHPRHCGVDVYALAEHDVSSNRWSMTPIRLRDA